MKTYIKHIYEYLAYVFSTFNDQEHGYVCDEYGYPIEWSEVQYRSRLFTITLTTIQMIFNLTICHFKGHALMDDSYGGPDSGCIDLTCTRCGYNFHQTLY